MNVRLAQIGDRAAIRPLLKQLMPERSDRGDTIWAEALRDERYAAWVAEDAGQLAGFVDVFLFPDVAPAVLNRLLHEPLAHPLPAGALIDHHIVDDADVPIVPDAARLRCTCGRIAPTRRRSDCTRNSDSRIEAYCSNWRCDPERRGRRWRCARAGG